MNMKVIIFKDLTVLFRILFEWIIYLTLLIWILWKIRLLFIVFV